MYQALYRKYRPQTFEDVIGQSHITDSLKNQVKTGRLSHAYIFIGTRGTGKTTCSRILAKAVNCEHPVNGNPCCRCAACRSIEDGEALDIVELDAASNNGVNDVRALRDEAVFSPTSLKKRVYIIDEVHMLSTPAFNALLKILEEPPEHLLFILATTELQKVPATILSRCQRHSFRRIKNNVLADYLFEIAQRETIDLTHEAASLIAGLGEGSVRDSLSMLDQCSAFEKIDTEQVYSSVGLAGNKRTVELFERIAEKDTEGALQKFNSLWEDGKEPSAILSELSSFGRDILMMKVAPKSASELVYGGYSRENLKRFAVMMTVEELTCIVESLQNAMAAMKERLSTKMTAELCLVSLSENSLGNSPESLRARISALEKLVKSGIPLVADRSEARAESENKNFVPENICVPAQKTNGSTECRTILEAFETPSEIQNSENEPSEEKESDIDQHITAELQSAAEAFEQPEVLSDTRDIDAFMEKVCEFAGPKIRMDMKFTLKDPEKRRAYLDGEILTIEVEPGFQFSSFSRSDVIDELETAASHAAGGSVRIKIAELEPKLVEKRNLRELRSFPEVKFE